MFSKNARLPQNKELQLLTQELVYMKQYKEDIVLDKMSLSDYFTAAAYFVVREAEGPFILNDLYYGRKDVKDQA